MTESELLDVVAEVIRSADHPEIPRFLDFAQEALNLAQHPDIVRIDTFDDPGTSMKPCGLAITTRDGKVFRLKVVRTSGPGGDDFTAPEVIPYPEYQFPEDIRWQPQDAQRADR